MDVIASLLDIINIIIITIIFIIVVFSYVKFLRIGSCGLGYYKSQSKISLIIYIDLLGLRS